MVKILSKIVYIVNLIFFIKLYGGNFMSIGKAFAGIFAIGGTILVIVVCIVIGVFIMALL